MDDDDLLADFEAGRPPSPFGHREHLRVMWAYARRLPAEEALAAVDAGIRRVAGDSGKYSRTVTVAWARLVCHVAATEPEATFEQALARHPEVLAKDALSRHYSAALLASPESRSAALEPDLLALP